MPNPVAVEFSGLPDSIISELILSSVLKKEWASSEIQIPQSGIWTPQYSLHSTEERGVKDGNLDKAWGRKSVS